MLWLETLSSFGCSYIEHVLPRGCDGAVSTVCLGRYEMTKSVTVASALGWVGICTGWNEVGYRGVLGLISAGYAQESGK